MNFVISVILIFLLLIGNEFLYRKYKKHGELFRKIVHILVGSFVAFWPYLMSYNLIRLVSLLFVLAVIISIRFNIFKSIHNVNRNSLGEIMFGISIGLTTFVANSHLIYTLSILAMSLGDGVAALIGTYYGKGNKYKIFGKTKSILGTLTFFSISLILILVYVALTHYNFNLWYVALAVLLTITENVSPTGLDNVSIPLLTAFFLV